MKKASKIAVIALLTHLLQACGGSNSPVSDVINPSSREINPLLRELSYQADLVNLNNEFSVEMGSDDISMLINLRVTDDAFISEIIGPSGKTLYAASLNGEDIKLNSDFYNEAMIMAGDKDLTGFLPPTPSMKLEAGTYRFKIVKTDGAKLTRARVFVKSRPANADIDLTDLKVDLNILITDADPKYRSQAFQDRLRGSYKTIINSVLSPYRITLDKVNVYLSTDAETSAFSVINVESFADESESCRAVVRHSASDMALNLLFITGFADSPTTAGVSPGAGVILDAVSHATCFAVARIPYSTFFAQNEDEMQATNILHEAMHFMSIPHTTETNGLVFDKIADTPECSAAIYDGRNNESFNEPGVKDGEVTDHECSFEGGANNVVFHGGHPDFLPYSITADQAWVLKRHPLTRLAD